MTPMDELATFLASIPLDFIDPVFDLLASSLIEAQVQPSNELEEDYVWALAQATIDRAREIRSLAS
jgi:hypothetical protein